MHLTRYYMYKHIESSLNGPMRGAILGIGGLDSFLPFIDAAQSKITISSYPEVDMQHLPYADGQYDYIISDQVLEHLEDPVKAVRESYRVCKPGGIVIHTTCFINYYHPSPEDFWRFSPPALRFLCKDFSEIIQAEAWGNRLAAILSLLGDRVRTMEIPDRKWSLRNLIATRNASRYPIVTWIIAKK